MEILNEAQVLKNWSSFVTESTGITDPSKVLWMSKMCQIQDSQDKSKTLNEWNTGVAHLNPAMNLGGMGDQVFPTGNQNGFNKGGENSIMGSGDQVTSNLPVAIQIAAQTIALDLLPVVPMTTPFGQIFMKDDVYEGGRIAGDTDFYKGGGKTDPTIVEAAIVGNDADYKKFLEDLEASDFVPGSEDAVFDLGGGYKLTFVKYGFISGLPIFVVKNGGEVNESGINGAGYSGQGSDTLVTLAEAGAAKGIQFALVRAKEDHVALMSTRELYSNSVTATGVKNPYDNNYGVEPYSRAEGEATPMNIMGAKFTSVDVKTHTVQIAYALTWEQIEDSKTYGRNAVAEAEAAMVNELSQTINKEVLCKMWDLGRKNAKALATQGTVLDTFFTIASEANSAPTGFNTETVEFGGTTQLNVQKRIMDKILYASNLISFRGHRGAGTFAIVSAKIATALQAIAGFAIAPMANTINQTTGTMYPVGAIGGITIYVDPNLPMNDTTVIVGRKGKADEPGLVFCPYIMAAKQTIVPPSTMGWQGAVKSRFAIVAAGQHPEVMYCTFNLVTSKSVSFV